MDLVEKAKQIIVANTKVLYGVFGIIESSGYLPTCDLLNQFFMKGSDPCDQDHRMDTWKPFSINEADYIEIKDWWLSKYLRDEVFKQKHIIFSIAYSILGFGLGYIFFWITFVKMVRLHIKKERNM